MKGDILQVIFSKIVQISDFSHYVSTIFSPPKGAGVKGPLNTPLALHLSHILRPDDKNHATVRDHHMLQPDFEQTSVMTIIFVINFLLLYVAPLSSLR